MRKEQMWNTLSNLRVLDFGSFIAAPYCATLLSDLGAEVIRLEKVDGGEDRSYTPVGADAYGALLAITGRNKKGMTLNPTRPEGAEVLKRLVASADIVIANRTEAALASLGLDYQSLRRIRDDIILVSVSAYGYQGPYAERIGYDNVAQSMSGAVYLTGSDGEPRKAAVPYCDYGTASLAAYATLAAVLQREKTGEGAWVRTSLLGTALAFNNLMLLEEQQLQIGRDGFGNLTPGAGPSGVFELKDGHLFIQVLGNPIFQRWTELLAIQHLNDDPRYQSDQSRGDHSEELNRIMQSWCDGRTKAEVISIMHAARIPCEDIATPAEVLDHPQVSQGGFFNRVDLPGFAKPAIVAKTPFSVFDAEAPSPTPAPDLSEHTASILSELGYSPNEIAELKEIRAV